MAANSSAAPAPTPMMGGMAAPGAGARADSGGRDAAGHLPAAWLWLAAAAIGVATLYAIVLVAARTPQVARLLPQGDLFHTALVLHVDLAEVIWFFAMAGALWVSAVPQRLTFVRWAAFALSAGGVAALALAPLAGGSPLANNYVPVLDNSLFLWGIAGFFAGTALNATLALWPRRGQRSDAAITLNLTALVVLLALAALLLSAGSLPRDLDRGLYFELLSWAPGHIAQFAFTLLMLAAWQLLAPAAGLSPPPHRLMLAVWLLALLPLLPAALLAVLFAPDSVVFRKGYTALMAYGAWPAPLLLGGWLAAKLLRSRAGAPGGTRLALWFSLLLFAAGCVLGAFIRTDSTMVPAHYHGTVGGVTVSLMALLLHSAGGGPQQTDGAAPRRLLAIYGGGLALMVAGLAWLAFEGAARKMPLAADGISSGWHFAASSLTGFGGLLAIVGGLLFFRMAAQQLWRGGTPAFPFDRLAHPLPSAAAAGRRRDVRLRAGLLALAAVLLLGAVFAYAPAPDTWRERIATALAGFAPVDKPSHAAQKRQEEITLRFRQGVAMLHSRQYEHAVTALHRVIELAPEIPEAHVNMGYALLGLGRFGAARDFFEGALALRRDQLNAYYGLAEAHEGLNDIPAAIGAMRTYVHLAPEGDPFRRKAESALWEWQERLARERSAAQAGAPAGHGPKTADGMKP